VVTQDAKNGFDDLLGMCLHEVVKTPANTDWSVKTVDKFADIRSNEFYILTISSYKFRVFLILHFSEDIKTRTYVANALNVAADKLEDRQYYDFLGEVGNAFCGIYKRELGKYIPHLGMSTPNRMRSATLEHLAIWNHEHVSHVRVKSDDDIMFFGSIYVSSYGDVDFRMTSKTLNEDVEMGALELF